MTQIAFLHGAADRLQAVGDWLQRHCHDNASVIVYTATDAQSELLDHALWSACPSSFIPHCRADDPLAALTPVAIVNRLAPLDLAPHSAYLLNFSAEIPPGFECFQHLIEIVSIDELDKQAGRERFRYYREHGHPILSQDISLGI